MINFLKEKLANKKVLIVSITISINIIIIITGLIVNNIIKAQFDISNKLRNGDFSVMTISNSSPTNELNDLICPDALLILKELGNLNWSPTTYDSKTPIKDKEIKMTVSTGNNDKTIKLGILKQTEQETVISITRKDKTAYYKTSPAAYTLALSAKTGATKYTNQLIEQFTTLNFMWTGKSQNDLTPADYFNAYSLYNNTTNTPFEKIDNKYYRSINREKFEKWFYDNFDNNLKLEKFSDDNFIYSPDQDNIYYKQEVNPFYQSNGSDEYGKTSKKLVTSFLTKDEINIKVQDSLVSTSKPFEVNFKFNKRVKNDFSNPFVITNYNDTSSTNVENLYLKDFETMEKYKINTLIDSPMSNQRHITSEHLIKMGYNGINPSKGFMYAYVGVFNDYIICMQAQNNYQSSFQYYPNSVSYKLLFLNPKTKTIDKEIATPVNEFTNQYYFVNPDPQRKYYMIFMSDKLYVLDKDLNAIENSEFSNLEKDLKEGKILQQGEVEVNNEFTTLLINPPNNQSYYNIKEQKQIKLDFEANCFANNGKYIIGIKQQLDNNKPNSQISKNEIIIFDTETNKMKFTFQINTNPSMNTLRTLSNYIYADDECVYYYNQDSTRFEIYNFETKTMTTIKNKEFLGNEKSSFIGCINNKLYYYEKGDLLDEVNYIDLNNTNAGVINLFKRLTTNDFGLDITTKNFTIKDNKLYELVTIPPTNNNNTGNTYLTEIPLP